MKTLSYVHDVLENCRALLPESDGGHAEIGRAMEIVRASLDQPPLPARGSNDDALIGRVMGWPEDWAANVELGDIAAKCRTLVQEARALASPVAALAGEREALQELVVLKDLKDSIECWVVDDATGYQWPKMQPYERRMAAVGEYNHRKPLAWAAARAALASGPTTQAPAEPASAEPFAWYVIDADPDDGPSIEFYAVRPDADARPLFAGPMNGRPFAWLNKRGDHPVSNEFRHRTAEHRAGWPIPLYADLPFQTFFALHGSNEPDALAPPTPVEVPGDSSFVHTTERAGQFPDAADVDHAKGSVR